MFHQDVLTHILLHLPVKSLLRFKCVSKQWLSVISSPQFHHRRRLLASSGIILCQTTDLIHHISLARSNSDPPFTSLSFIDHSAGVKILQSSNGLLLCCSSLHKVGIRRSYYICNPSTKQVSTLPEADCESKTISGVYLAFDTSKSPHYQVVSVRSCSSPSSSNSYRIVTYSSETRAWRLSGSPFAAPDMVFDNGVLWNGAIHWISPTGDSLCFDIDQERLGTLPSLPSTEKWSNRRLRYFGESGGHLHLIEVYGSATQFHVFEMERDYSSWLPKYQVDIAAIVDAFPLMVRNYPDANDSVFYAFSLLFVKEDEEDPMLLLQVPVCLVLDPREANSAAHLVVSLVMWKKCPEVWIDRPPSSLVFVLSGDGLPCLPLACSGEIKPFKGQLPPASIAPLESRMTKPTPPFLETC